jgi:DNA-binding NarL/FixJ family response regulator
VSVLRPAQALLLVSESYLRAVFVLVGAALALALGIVDFTILSLVAEAGAPAWATAVIGVVLVGGPLLMGLVPAVRQVEGVAVQGLLVVEFPDGLPGPATGWPQRRRTEAWFLLHVVTGAVVVAAVVGLIALGGSWWTVPAAAATLLGTLLIGRFLAWLGPVLLGPSYAERLRRLEDDAARATERNRIAREIHDSVGHALSVVTVQASAARKVIERDPGFAANALATIETTSRRAAAELDVYDALRAGARGFLLKRATADDFVNAIRTVHNGESLLFPAAIRRLATGHGALGGRGLAEANLTDRETEVLRLIAQGRSNSEIAAELFLGVETVKTHVRNVLAKLGARDRVQAVITAYESGFIR